MLIFVQKSSLLLDSFTTYYALKNPAIWLAKSILNNKSRTKILPDMKFAQKYKQQYVFHFRLIAEKSNDKIFQKIHKHHFWDVFWLFLPKIGLMRIF